MTHFSSKPRAVFLRLVSLGVLLYTLWNQITCGGDKTGKDHKPCQDNHTEFQVIILLDVMRAVLIFIFRA